MAFLTDPLVLARFVHIAACVVVSGTAVFAVFVVPGPQPAMEALRRRWRLMIAAGAAIAAVSGLVWLALVAANIAGTSLPGPDGLWAVASGTRFGRLALARTALALIVLLPLWTDRPRAAFALALLVLLAPAGHAGAQAGPGGWVHLSADALHVVAAAGWLGGLPAFAMTLAAALRDPAGLAAAARTATARFSRLGMACVGTLVATGAVSACILLSSPAELVTTRYGQVLSVKLALFAAMVAVAAVNRLHLTPRLAQARAQRALCRNSLCELALGAGVLFLVAILGTLEPGAHGHDAGAIPDNAAFVHIHAAAVMADVTVTPDPSGPSDILIRLSHEDSTAYAARAVHVALRPPEADAAAIAFDAKQGSDALWEARGITLPRPGIWTLVLSITPHDGGIVVLDGPIVIAP